MNKSTIRTKRLNLRQITWSDLEDIHNLHSHAETDRFNTLGIPKDTEETRETIEPWNYAMLLPEIKNYVFAVENEESFVGLLGLKLARPVFKMGEVWYKLMPSNWSRGYATEALNGMLDFGFGELGLHRIEAGCAVENLASIRVLEKVGMFREGTKRKVLPLKSGWSDNFEYAILNTDKRNL